ncbi:MAG: tetratricopeptide repeat protein [Planctomycetota bacterium]
MNTPDLEPDSFRCPTCGAKQAPSSECRRCKCDLELVVGVYQSGRALHQAYLRYLRAGDYRQALDCALRRFQLAPDDTARRLLVVAYLHLGQYRAALDVSGMSDDESVTAF